MKWPSTRGDARVRLRLDARDLVGGRAALDLQVGQIGVPELRERIVADEQRTLGAVRLAGDGEVPGQVEVVAVDAASPSVSKMPSMWWPLLPAAPAS